MNDFPELNIRTPTHSVKITRENEPTLVIAVNAANSYAAIVMVLQSIYGDDRDVDLPSFIIKCERMK